MIKLGRKEQKNSFSDAAPIYMLMGMLPLQAAKREFLCASKYEISKFWEKYEISINMKREKINQTSDFVSRGILIQKFIIYDILKPADNICYHFEPHKTIIIKITKVCDLCAIISACYVSFAFSANVF
ncbi:hypothetical protein QL285_014319 [Trifolium repens]|jgi:hypothetical protein|nr:hypothetical protein QL285_014319 [Trifolium repens]